MRCHKGHASRVTPEVGDVVCAARWADMIASGLHAYSVSNKARKAGDSRNSDKAYSALPLA
jgi:hypothetical protein